MSENFSLENIQFVSGRCAGSFDQMRFKIAPDKENEALPLLLQSMIPGDYLLFYDPISHAQDDESSLSIRRTANGFTAMHGGHGHSGPEEGISGDDAVKRLLALMPYNRATTREDTPWFNLVHRDGVCLVNPKS